ncbi:MAG: AAA family ATPase [candidate division KSB1 bacterium]|nr:AAA family ATPase [candidate division KSB1 bacterium]MDZ7272613.1 AAA family ATPase [candidate division KSB1 bacterium]MDZ7284364.1 AAA family ATPase [candidate division KSB1 bacterium]MDZ7297240.1 AAA family ATPase [candidate division KSB1 bacterium]MDZ7308307.1 AAA family ATPase [candidate division KSB1 bacterium]
MTISRVFIRAFKSIFELAFPLDPKITALVGANESGKTNILKALHAFSPGAQFDNTLTCQYSDYYYQGKCPEVALEFSQISKENRRNLLRFSEAFKDSETLLVKKDGPTLDDYHVFVGESEINLREKDMFLATLPKLLYFDEIQLLKNRATLEDLLEGGDHYRTERNLLRIGGINNPELIFEDSTRGRRASEEASRLITQQVRRAWSQEPTIEIKLNVNGNILYIDISDGTTVFDTPESRSLGFRWYLSFYINFIAQTVDARANEFIFLVDEAGIHLHPAGQKDLIRVMEDLAIKNQIVYTTHSPFMINRENPQRVRLVVKDKDGTSVDSEAYRENWKPLRNSIGLMISDLFFFSDRGVGEDSLAKKSGFFRRGLKPTLVK